MDAEILAIGTELLMGQIANTNAQYISKRLPDVGVNVYYHSVVGDNPKRLKECLDIALSRSDVIITTGGLGPTQDDLTKETIAKALNRKLVLNEEVFGIMKDFFSRMNRIMTQNNIKQAYLPENCIVVKNKNGTAPGCIIEEAGKVIIMLPGPPSEMKPMFEEVVIPYFRSKSAYRLESKYIKIFGIGESMVEEKIIDLIERQSNPTIAPYAKEGEVTLRITAKYENAKDNDDLLTPVVEEICSRLGNAVYSIEDKSLDEVVAGILMEKNVTLSIAESCTGGLVSSRLTEFPGISKVFIQSVVCYSNRSKAEILGVKQETLDKYGAVSRETAVEMAEGIRRISNTVLGLAITGIAGPGGGTDVKPVGLVYIALASKNTVKCKELRLWGSRSRIRNVTGLHAFDMLRRHIMGIDDN